MDGGRQVQKDTTCSGLTCNGCPAGAIQSSQECALACHSQACLLVVQFGQVLLCALIIRAASNADGTLVHKARHILGGLCTAKWAAPHGLKLGVSGIRVFAMAPCYTACLAPKTLCRSCESTCSFFKSLLPGISIPAVVLNCATPLTNTTTTTHIPSRINSLN